MWAWNPKPWMHVFDYAAMFGGPVIVSLLPMKNDKIDVLFAGAFIITGMVSYAVNDVVMGVNHWKESVKDVRMFAQPTEEEKNGQRHFIRDVVRDTVVTSGNVNIPMDKAPEAVRKIPDGFVAMQNTAELVGLREVDSAINKICRRTWTLIENPDLGYPAGDFREVTWVKTKKMTRKTLLLSIAILERHGGIERAGSNGNSTWIVADPEVIKRGARTPLPHPIDCYCADCAQK
jgi:hypothetical protein